MRKSFIPRDDHYFFMIDYDSQEFRLMLDYAGEHKLISKIMEGYDPHQATADEVNLARKPAKTLNFGLIYGMGVDKLAEALGVPRATAREMRLTYFSKLPKVKRFLNQVSQTGKSRGYVRNRYGRRCHIANHEHAYILPNHIVSGSCADAMKQAMNEIHSYIQKKNLKSRMLIQVHDELVFEVPKDEIQEVLMFKAIMEKTYVPQNGMYLTCSVEHSQVSWGACDKVKGMP